MKELTERMVQELFDNGRCADGIRPVCEELAQEHGQSLEPGGELEFFVRQLEREHGALSAEVERVSGLCGDTSTAIRAGRKLLSERFQDGAPQDWALSFDSALRSRLGDLMQDGIRAGESALRIAENMQAEVQAHAEALGRVVPGLSSVALPDAARLGMAEQLAPVVGVGSFGTVAFQVGRSSMLTLHDFVRRRSTRTAEHTVLVAKPRMQFVGTGLWDLSFRIRLAVPFVRQPASRVKELEAMQETGEAHSLVLGSRNYGDYILTELEERPKHYAPGGGTLVTELSLCLKEYV